MESGTILHLHLALLKKIRSRSPASSQAKRLKNYRSVYSYHSNPSPFTSHTSRQLSQKYSSSNRQELNFVRKKSNSFDQIKNLQNRCEGFGEEAFTLSGWNNNEQEFDFKKIAKRNGFKCLHKQLQPFKNSQQNEEKPTSRRKFTYCQQEVKQFNLFSTKKDNKVKQFKSQRNTSFKPVTIEEPKNQSSSKQPYSPFQMDKQNSFSDFFKPSSFSEAKKRLSQKKTVQKITSFIEQFTLYSDRKVI